MTLRSNNRITGTIEEYVIIDKSSNPYTFRDNYSAVLCAAHCNSFGQLDRISLKIIKDGCGFQPETYSTTFEELLEIWPGLLYKQDSLSVESYFRDHFERKYPLFIV